MCFMNYLQPLKHFIKNFYLFKFVKVDNGSNWHRLFDDYMQPYIYYQIQIDANMDANNLISNISLLFFLYNIQSLIRTPIEISTLNIC